MGSIVFTGWCTVWWAWRCFALTFLKEDVCCSTAGNAVRVYSSLNLQDYLTWRRTASAKSYSLPWLIKVWCKDLSMWVQNLRTLPFQNFAWSWLSLHSSWTLCLSSPTCSVCPPWIFILKNLPSKYPTQKILENVHSKQNLQSPIAFKPQIILVYIICYSFPYPG